jgi:hypothetical protein
MSNLSFIPATLPLIVCVHNYSYVLFGYLVNVVITNRKDLAPIFPSCDKIV